MNKIESLIKIICIIILYIDMVNSWIEALKNGIVINIHGVYLNKEVLIIMK